MSELGESLKSERLTQGLTLQDVFERTRISAGVLKNLEDGSYERIGTPLLVRSFVRKYCSALGIDPEPLLEAHAAEIIACDRQPEGIKEYRRLTFSLAHEGRKWAALAIVLALVVIGSIVGGGWVAQKRANWSISQSKTKEIIPQQELPSDLPRVADKVEPEAASSEPAKQPEQIAATAPTETELLQAPEIKEQSIDAAENGVPDVEVPAPDSEELKPVTSVAAQAGQEASSLAVIAQDNETGELSSEEQEPALQIKEHLLTAEASQDVWVQVRTDNKETFNALMKAGDKREWKAQENVKIVIGNAGGIILKWDGKTLKSLGKSGEVVRFRLPDPKYMEES
jgi:cytoskeletal protein RodZ